MLLQVFLVQIHQGMAVMEVGGHHQKATETHQSLGVSSEEFED